jgi:hypothetical protein
VIGMARGGSRNRSGPAKDENSRTSERQGFVLSALPPAGFDGEAPEFPLMPFTVYRWEHAGDHRYQVRDDDATEAFRERESELWATIWTYPQACAWSSESWRWQAVAMWARTAVVCESSEATAADKGAIHRFADQIGLTPAGLKENGWKIAVVDSAPAVEPTEPDEDEDDPRNRLSVVRDGTGG